MRQWSGSALAAAAAVALACAGTPASLPTAVQEAPPDSAFAVFRPDRLFVGFPRVPAPANWPSNRATRGINAYGWRFGTEGADRMIASFGVRVKRDPDAPPYGSFRSVLEHANLMLCNPEPSHVLTCGRGPLAARAFARRGRLVLAVEDTALLASFRRLHPEVLWMLVTAPDTTVHVDAVPVTYRSGRTQERDALVGSYASCSEAWGHWETLRLDEQGFRHWLATDVSEPSTHTGKYLLRGRRLVLVADSGPAPRTDFRIGGPLRFDSLAFVADTIGGHPVLWRSDEFRAAYRDSGRLNKFGLLVRAGTPADDIRLPDCRTDIGGPFDGQ